MASGRYGHGLMPPPPPRPSWDWHSPPPRPALPPPPFLCTRQLLLPSSPGFTLLGEPLSLSPPAPGPLPPWLSPPPCAAPLTVAALSPHPVAVGRSVVDGAADLVYALVGAGPSLLLVFRGSNTPENWIAGIPDFLHCSGSYHSGLALRRRRPYCTPKCMIDRRGS